MAFLQGLGQRQGNGEVPLFEGKCAGCGRWFAVRYRGELPSHGRGSRGGEGEDWCRSPGKPVETRPRKVAPRTSCPECRLEGVQVGALLRCVNPACRVVAFDVLSPVSRGRPGPVIARLRAGTPTEGRTPAQKGEVFGQESPPRGP